MCPSTWWTHYSTEFLRGLYPWIGPHFLGRMILHVYLILSRYVHWAEEAIPHDNDPAGYWRYATCYQPTIHGSHHPAPLFYIMLCLPWLLWAALVFYRLHHQITGAGSD